MSNHLPPPSKELPSPRYLDPDQVEVFRDDAGRLLANIGEELTVLSPRFLRVSPLTDPDRYLSIRGTGPNDKEFGILRNWRGLDRDSRRLVEAELERRYLYPRVSSIVSLKDYYGLQLCTFDTDRGLREVTLRDVRDNVVYLGSARVIITDAEGNRYDIPDAAALDNRSRALLAEIL